MVAGERQAGENDLGLLVRRDGRRGQRIPDDLVVLFGIEPAMIEGDAGAARRALRDAIAKALDHIRMAVAFAILQRHQKTAGRRLVVAIIAAAPGVDVEHAVRRKHHVTGVPEIVGENGRAEALGKRDAAVIAGAGVRSRTNRICLSKQRWRSRNQDCKEQNGCKNCCAMAPPGMKGQALGHDECSVLREMLELWTNTFFQQRRLLNEPLIS